MRLMRLGLRVHVVGETASVAFAERARMIGSRTAVLTSQQFAGSLFEQSVLPLFDSLVHTPVRASGLGPEALWARHANLE